MNYVLRVTSFIFMFILIFALLQGLASGDVTLTTPWGTFNIALDATALSGIVITFAVLIALVGIQILGSGLGDTSVQVISRIIVYALVWSIFSVFACIYFTSITHAIGTLLYWILTVLFFLGVFIDLREQST